MKHETLTIIIVSVLLLSFAKAIEVPAQTIHPRTAANQMRVLTQEYISGDEVGGF